MLKLGLAILLGAAALPGQLIDASKAGDSVRIAGDWRFHPGDNLSWANPGFDDSDWRLVSTKKDWDHQGLQAVRGYFWYRTRIKLPRDRGPLSLLLNEAGPYDLFIDGKQAGRFGRFPPDSLTLGRFPRIYALAVGRDDVSLALRFWISPVVFHVANEASDIVIGTKEGIERRYRQSIDSTLMQEAPDFVIEAIQIILFVELLMLFFLQRERAEYLFLALALLATFVNGVLSDMESFVPMSLFTGKLLDLMTQVVAAIFMIEFVFRFLEQPVPKWLRLYQFAMSQVWVLVVFAWSGWIDSVVLNVVFTLFFVPYWVLLPGLLIWRAVRGNKEAGLLAIPISLGTFDSVVGTVGWVLYQLHLRSSSAPVLGDLQWGEISVSPDSVFYMLFLVSITVLILARFQQTRMAQVRAQAELEAARNMQEVMVPQLISAANFQIETVYLPATEVGGDFFQLFPGEDGSLLVVIGDVSGKGMKAAMLVSMILGLLRRTVDQTRSPAKILNDVNRLLIGHTDGKFATCCCALIDPHGTMAVANAGHLSPYCDGEEMELPGGVPLGLSADAEYKEVQVPVPPGKRLVFLSDGVVEARSKSGELYGFERTRSISIRAVKEIAAAAQQFGQEDDITVLGIRAFA